MKALKSSKNFMEQILFQLFIITGVLNLTLTTSVHREYYLIQQVKTWSDAQTYCNAKYTGLASIESSSDLSNAVAVLKKQNFVSSAWIGLYNDVNSWRWSLNNTPLGSYSKWKFLEPNNQNGQEQCVKTDEFKYWYDADCTQKNFCICYNERQSNLDKYILTSDTKRSWLASQTYCRQTYTDLASVRDYNESVEVMRKVLSGTVWIGLYRSSWKWTDKANTSAIVWNSGQPDNKGGQENCACILKGTFVDTSCSDQHAFLCQYIPPPKTKQIISVVIQSSQNVNQTVTAAILDKIEQKLKTQGMEVNAMLTWKKQPDGALFQKKLDNSGQAENATSNIVCI